MSDPTPDRSNGPSVGVFIVFEGIDGAGTTTQARRLESWLRARHQQVLLTREPSDGPVGMLIRQILTGRLVQCPGVTPPEPVSGRTVALLFAADRLDHVAAEVEPALRAGVHVVSDRYVHSSLAYQAAEAPLPWVRELNRFARVPDLTLFVQVRPEVALARIRRDRPGAPERFEHLAMLEKVHDNYVACLRTLADEAVVTIDGERPIDEVFQAVTAAVTPLLDPIIDASSQ